MLTNLKGVSRRWTADLLVAATLVAALYGLMHLGSLAPDNFATAGVDLGAGHLPYYAARSVLRMLGAYVLSLLFTIVYGYPAAYNQRAARIMLPALDILQSIPVLSFMPSVVLALVALFPHSNLGPELASIILIFTGQAWNMTFSFIHSLQTIPADLREIADMVHMSRWQRFRYMEMPFAAVGLVWNSMMSWAGGWFFLMASEMFALGNKQFRMPGLGSYLMAAADAGAIHAVLLGVLTLVTVIVLLDQLVWRPVVAWADKFKVELIQTGAPPRSAILTILRRSTAMEWLTLHVIRPADEWLEMRLARRRRAAAESRGSGPVQAVRYGLAAAGALLVLLGIWRGGRLVLALPVSIVGDLALATGASFLRVLAATAIGLAWTIPAGVAIGMNQRLAAVLQPVTQILASIPATALFPVILMVLLRLPGGLNLAAVVLLMMGTQWYLLFNIIAGASSMPADLKEAATSLRLTGWAKWKTLILPAIFPQLVTGLVTASGGAWNATIVSEYVRFGGEVHATVGLGSMIARATAAENFPELLVATLTLALVVVGINRFVWRRLYTLAETRYTL
jgi:NitT/TauT family transport system permease protein